MVERVAPNEGYLTTDLSTDERKRLFEHDKLALWKMQENNGRFDAVVKLIREMHFEQGLPAEEITERMIATYPGILDGKRVSEKRVEILAYIKKVIYQKD